SPPLARTCRLAPSFLLYPLTSPPVLHTDALRPSPPFFFFHATAPTEIYTLSLHDALPISTAARTVSGVPLLSSHTSAARLRCSRSEEHTSELQSRFDLVCRLLLEKKKNTSHSQNLDNLRSPNRPIRRSPSRLPHPSCAAPC